jgi:hypothetical protein
MVSVSPRPRSTAKKRFVPIPRFLSPFRAHRHNIILQSSNRVDLLINTRTVLHFHRGYYINEHHLVQRQTVIPAEICKRHALTEQSRLAWIDDGSNIRVVPLPEGPRNTGAT